MVHIVHAVASPIIFGAASFVCFSEAPSTTPLETAVIYTAVVIVLDLVVLATIVERRYAMFASVLGTWLPFALIFGATDLVGTHTAKRPPSNPLGDGGSR